MLLLLVTPVKLLSWKQKTSHPLAANHLTSDTLPFSLHRLQLQVGPPASINIPKLRDWGRGTGLSLACCLLPGSKPCWPSCCCLEELIQGAGGEISENKTPGFEPDGSEARQLICMRLLAHCTVLLSLSATLHSRPLKLKAYIQRGALCERQQWKWGFRCLRHPGLRVKGRKLSKSSI